MGALLSEPVRAMVVERAASEPWTASMATMQGWRRTHEDAHIFQCAGGGAEDSGFFAVLDGHGGDLAARAAAGMLEEQLLPLARRGTLEASVAARELTGAFLSVDAQLRQQLPDGDSSGTTVVAAVITRQRSGRYCVQLAHAGDSRAVVRTGRELVCSEDHKPQREDERRRIVAAGGTVEHGSLGGAGAPLRVDGALAVSRALGDFQYKTKGMAPELCKVTAVPEVRTVANCSAGDWLLLACDGIFDVITNEELRDFVETRLQRAAPQSADGGAIVVELLQLCLDRGSKDNCTACLVQLCPGSSSTPHSRELLQGPWPTAAPTMQVKYAEFFAAHGFQEAADAVHAKISQAQKPCAHPR
uniref:PPM-type phosphatase domain-containing protein n=1 Tax=Pyrodinium bahamense TaxID=73915 RepID=A0A7R9ZXK1_9DINO|mmetsp:Transcript_13412/g.37080  ORF Transcript_13412/g.37080 Transcript_13412/m.37080 type:complete len:359 (+) Transcript_13412:102-1178(+)|eukprot:CAMPEP_0179121268 /NCGR_PEP_ID=MMETSP0796-20121207/57180_1 /TAXON_ID=73915 /ORGANISM="Pyrodinium bahamense, Strain pbaha01" /LENGTH=358 /DNA_ID=CAMNT_0020819849 /DNA_START=44 /DNA_END=1120 /DNA_ORIENTATION=+